MARGEEAMSEHGMRKGLPLPGTAVEDTRAGSLWLFAGPGPRQGSVPTLNPAVQRRPFSDSVPVARDTAVHLGLNQ